VRLYDDLAAWWPLISPPSEYGGEAADLVPRLQAALGSPRGTLLELGAGGGSLAFHLKRRFQLTLTDLAPAMLAVSQAINPECEHLVGDMRSLRLGRLFDIVLIHDAIMYATEPRGRPRGVANRGDSLSARWDRRRPPGLRSRDICDGHRLRRA
jgi:SAM-dependent methyltransferase